MDAALLRKIDRYPTGAGRPGLGNRDDYTHSTVIDTDAETFHGSNEAETQHSEETPPPPLPEPDYHDGLKDGQAKSDLMYQNTISVMQQTLASLQKELVQMARQIEVQHLSSVQTCLNTVFPTLMSTGSHKELMELISQITQQGVTGKIRMITHPDAEDDCKRLCELHAEEFIISTDDTLNPLQVRVLWEQGGVELDCETAATSFQQQLNTALASLSS